MRRIAMGLALSLIIVAASPSRLGAQTTLPPPFPDQAPKIASASALDMGQEVQAPEGLLDSPAQRERRVALSIASGAGIAGGLTLAVVGICGLAQNFQNGFTSSAVQNGVLEISGGLTLCSLFSFCLTLALDVPTGSGD
jgi:hypothetical protein